MAQMLNHVKDVYHIVFSNHKMAQIMPQKAQMA